MLPPQSGDPNAQGASPTPQNGAGANGHLVPLAPPQVPSMPMVWADPFYARPDLLTSRPDPIGLLKALRRNWLLAAILAVVSGITCFVLAWTLIPLYYEIEALIQVSRIEESVLGKQRPVDSETIKSFMRTQPFLVKGPNVLDAALRDPKVSQSPLLVGRPDKVGWLKDNLIVGFLGDSEVMQIKLRDEYPDEMVKIVNAVADAYLREEVQKRQAENNKKLERLREQYNQLMNEINRDETRLNELSQRLGTLDDKPADAKERQISEKIHALRSEKSQIERDITRNQVDTTRLQSSLAFAREPKFARLAMEDALLDDPEIRELEADLRAMRRMYNEQMRLARHPNSPAVTGYYAEVTKLEKQLNEAKADLLPLLQERYEVQTSMEIEAQLVIVQKEKEILEAKKETIEREIKEHEIELEKVRQYDQTVAELRRRLDPAKKTAEELQQQIAALQIDSSMQTRIQQLSRATIPEGRDRTAWLVLVSFCGVAGTLLALAGFGFHQFMQRRIESSAQVRQGLGLTVLGALPDLSSAKSAARQALVSGQLNESIDGIRARLIFGDASKHRQVILVTSAVELEGKSTVASQLAASLARCGRRTLLIDGDLRRPTLHSLFEMDLGSGLSELVRGDVALQDVLRPTAADNLCLMTAGQCTYRSIQALAHDGAARHFEALRQQFDFIIVDTAPVLACADSLLLGQFVDSAILSVRKDRSQAHRVYEAFERLAAVNIEFFGTVVNGECPHAGRRAQQIELLQPAEVATA